MTQFSVAQVLEAGQKAEFENKLDYAFQFYKHITDHHAQAPEAQAARDGLARLSSQAQQAAAGHEPAEPVNGKASTAPPGQSAPAPAQAPPAAQQPSPATAPAGYAPPARQLPAAAPAPHTVALPPPINDYRAGKLVAGMLSTFGWILFALGPVAAALSFTTIGSQIIDVGRSGMLGGLVGVAIIALVPMLLGITIVFWGQAARAIFDNANATRELLDLQRVLAGVGHRDDI